MATSNLEKYLDFKPYKPKKGEDYMSLEQINHFKNILYSWKKQLMSEAEKTMDHMKQDSSKLSDPNDAATQEEEFRLELRTRDRERKLISKIATSIEQVKNDDYGWCESCGDEIGIKRLEARPTATHCIDCKTLDEIKEKQLNG